MSISGINNNNYNYNETLISTNNTAKKDNSENVDTAQAFKNAVEEMIEANKLTPNNIQKERDFREMSDKEWDKLMDHIDKYLDAKKEELENMKEMQEEAAMKMAAEAPANMKTIAAANAALKVSANGITDGLINDDTMREKESWTYNMQTDDQTILAKAKMANEYVADMMTKAQELAITDSTTVGTAETVDGVESATYDEDENKDKIWTITAYSSDGIISKRFQNGVELDGWELKYNNPSDAQKVWDFISGFDISSDLKFAGSKEFREEFLAGRVSKNDLTNVDNVWTLNK